MLAAAGVGLLEAFDAPFMRRALLEVLLLAVPGGVIGAWIVLRRLAFFTHAAGTAAFPGLVVAGPLGVAPQLAALACGLGLAGGLERLGRSRRLDADAALGLLLVAALALGVILASDVARAGAGVDRLLFGSLVGVSDTDLLLSAALAPLALLAGALGRRSWLAGGFDPAGAGALGLSARAADLALLAVVAVAVVVALDAVGALLVAAVFVLPAATVRLLTRRLGTLQAGSVALAAGQGAGGLWLARVLDVAPGPAIAVLGGGVFALVAAVRGAWG